MPASRMLTKRLANQEVLRQVNERTAELNEAFAEGFGLDTMLVCECADLGCTEPISLPLSDYRRIREDPQLFIVIADHADEALEEIVEVGDGYAIVRLDPDVRPPEMAA